MKGFGFWAVIPCQDFGRGKTRLASVLAPEARRRFSRVCLRRVIEVARGAAGAQRTVVVSGSAEVLGMARRAGVRALRERRHGLNRAVRQASDYALRHGARGVVVLHSDLPQLVRADVERMLRALARNGGVVLAPDRDQSGTNALAVTATGRFDFRFGEDSYRRHRREARRRRMRVTVIRTAGLSCDVDTPQHFAMALQGLRLEPDREADPRAPQRLEVTSNGVGNGRLQSAGRGQ